MDDKSKETAAEDQTGSSQPIIEQPVVEQPTEQPAPEQPVLAQTEAPVTPTEPEPGIQLIPSAPVETPAAVPATPIAEVKPAVSKRLNKKIIITAAAVLAVIAALAVYFVVRSSNTANKTAQSSTAQSMLDALTPEKVEQSIPVETRAGISWLGEPQLTTDVDILDHESEQYKSSAAYVAEYGGSFYKVYKLGTDGNKEIFAIASDYNAFDGMPTLLFTKEGESYQVIKNNSEKGAFSENGTYVALKPGVEIDSSMTYQDLVVADHITYDGAVASKVYEMWTFLPESETKNFTKVKDISNGTVYEDVTESNSEQPNGIKQFAVFLKQPSGAYVKYRVTSNLLKDDNSLSINWNNGTTTNDSYQWQTYRNGCGLHDYVNVLDKTYFNDLIEVGSATSGGEKIYTLPKDHIVIQNLYDTYSAFRDDAVSLDEFYNNNGAIFVRNEIGYRVVLVNNKYQRSGECGKPVIYLYPEEESRLNVKVAADVTVSEPYYNPASGWDVVAQPNGNLTVDNQHYDSLFWEGLGHGTYPDITQGFVVEQSVIESTLKQHLSQLGLNSKESADFMEFWLPLMPNTPYIRLTWFNTAQMNRLAPLSLSKTPDTTIRIFLDFEGLQSPISLPPQKLSHPERKGFTLVEWGGLLIK